MIRLKNKRGAAPRDNRRENIIQALKSLMMAARDRPDGQIIGSGYMIFRLQKMISCTLHRARRTFRSI